MARSIKDLKVFDNSTLARKFNALVDEVERRTVNVVSPLYLTETGSATVIQMQRQRGGGGGSSTPAPDYCPFDLVLTPQVLPSTDFDLAVLPGTVNSQVPADLLNVITYDPTTTVFVKIHCLTDGKSVTSSTMVIDASAPSINLSNESEGSASFDICVAVIVAGTVTKVLGWCGSITVSLEEDFIVDKVSPSVGESPYTRWYRWDIRAQE